MSRSALKGIQAAAGAGGDPVYVDDVFSTFVYDGNGSARTITNGIDLSGEGGLVWVKHRGGQYSVSNNYYLVDTARGATKTLFSNATSAESTDSSGVTGFTSSGFTIGTGNEVNQNGNPIVSWTFRKQPGFFDVVTYTGNGTTQTINHSLGSVPGMIIVKSTSGSYDWAVYHRGLNGGTNSEQYGLYLNTTQAQQDNDTLWNDTAPTSTEFSVGKSSGASSSTNANGATYVAYVFAHDAQDFGEDSDEAIIKCGTYTGNGSSTGPTVNLGFEPQWLLVKAVTGSDGWVIWDTMRGMVVGGNDAQLQANSSVAEYSGYSSLDINPTGFTYTHNGAQYNGSGVDYIYMAIGRPHKPASEFAATDLFDTAERGDDGPDVKPSFVSNFVVDAAIWTYLVSTTYNRLHARLMGTDRLRTNATDAADTDNSATWDYMDGWYNPNSYQADWQSWMWRRAPGFFDVTTFTGDALDNKQVNHNLGVVPEMFWVMRRDSTSHKGVYHKDSPDIVYSQTYKKVLFLGQNSTSTTTTPFRKDLVTASSIAISNQYQQNENNGEYIVFLFASAAGISKVGSYTGTGSDINVNCGFSNGARFVLIKREDSSGDWYVWDSLQGIVAGNDPYFFLNSTAAQVTNTDYIDPLSSGFTVTSSAPAALNASGGNYIFYAIA